MAAYPMYGHSQMPMPMPGGYSTQPASNHQQSFSTPHSYSSTPYPVSPQNSTAGSNTTSEADQWKDQAIENLTKLVSHCTKEELQSFIDNEDRLGELVQDSEELKKFQRKRDDLIDNNKDQALKNMAVEPELKILKEELMQLVQQQNDLKEKYVRLQSEISGKVSLDTMSAVMQAATSEKESETEALTDQLLGANLTLDEFLERYIPERQSYHLRKIRSDKLVQLVGSGINVNTERPTPIPRPRPNPANIGYNYMSGGYGGYS